MCYVVCIWSGVLSTVPPPADSSMLQCQEGCFLFTLLASLA
jgi:hypothetical protein